MTTSNTLKSDVLFAEAPASWNTKYLTPDGFECQLTLRGETGQEVLERAQGAITFLLKNGCVPCTSNKNNLRSQVMNNSNSIAAISNQNTNGNGASSSNNGNHSSGETHTTSKESNSDGNGKGWCPIHQCEMKKWDKDGRVWYSHKVDGQWCSGKVKSK